jgi:hypothetical protein
MTGDVKLTDAQRQALEVFDKFPLGAEEIETTDIDAGLAVINRGFVTLEAPLVGGPVWLRLTPAGRHALGKTEGDQ